MKNSRQEHVLLNNTGRLILMELQRKNGKSSDYALFKSCKVTYINFSRELRRLFENNFITDNGGVVTITLDGYRYLINSKSSHSSTKEKVPKFFLTDRAITTDNFYVPSRSRLSIKNFPHAKSVDD